MAATVAPQARFELLFAAQRRRHRVGEPFARLEGPAAADPEERVGRIVEDDEGAHEDEEATAVAHDVGTDFGGFSAEERAMHIEPGP